MEPFRALVADKLNNEQRSFGFVVQTLIIGIGTWIASNLPWMVSKMGVSNESAIGVLPMSVKVAFAIGAFVFILSILYTIFTTSEEPPADMETFKLHKKESRFIEDLTESLRDMPSTMKKLGVIQFFSWFAFFTMWSMANPALTEHVFKASSPTEKLFDLTDVSQKATFDQASVKYQEASNLVGSAMGVYGLSSMAFALLLTLYTSKNKINRKYIHLGSLAIGGIGFLFMNYATPETLYLSFILIGIAWGSILSMPYAMLSSSVNPNKMGIMMGLFNMFIVIPQIVAAVGGINFFSNLIGTEAINAMTLAGISLLIAAMANLLITEKKAIAD